MTLGSYCPLMRDKWVPERYRAMYLMLKDNKDKSIEGEEIFEEIVNFHRLSFRGK